MEAKGDRGELAEVDNLLAAEGELNSSSEGELLVEGVLGGDGQVKLVVELALNDDTVGQLVLSTNSTRGSKNAALVGNFEGSLSVRIVEVSRGGGESTDINRAGLRVGLVLEVNFVLGVSETSEEVVSQEVEGGEVERTNDSVVDLASGDVVSVSDDGGFTGGKFKTGVGLASLAEVVGSESELELGKRGLSLDVGEEIPLLAVEGDLAEVEVSAEVTLSALSELDGEAVTNGELDLAFVDDVRGDLVVLLDGVDLNLVVKLTAVGGRTLDLIGLEGSVNVVVRQDVVRSTKTGERR